LQPRILTKPQLHVLLGHAGSEAIDHLADNVIGIEPPQGSAPHTINCEECSQNKAHQIISRRIGHERGASRAFETVALDLIKLDISGYNGHKYAFHGFDLYTKLNFVYTIPRRDKQTLLDVLKRLDQAIKREFNCTVTFIIGDDEKGYGLKDDSVRAYCIQEGINFQIRSPHTKEQNGSAERSGKNLIDRSRSMRVTSNLPLALSPEIYVAAGYLLNRTPTKALGWKTPFEIAYQKKPSIAHLRQYGCRAYALRPQIPRGDKLTPRALIGYLVGFDASNIYRVWLPKAKSRAHQGKVIRTRDVTFKENHFYQHEDELDPLLQGETLDVIAQTLHMPSLQNPEESSESETEMNHLHAINQTETNGCTNQTKSTTEDQIPQLPTPGNSLSPQPITSINQSFLPSSQASSNTLDFDTGSISDTQPTLSEANNTRQLHEESTTATSSSRKRKRRDSINADNTTDLNVAQNREVIDSNLRQSHVLPQGSTRTRKPSQKKNSSFFISKYWSTFVAASTTGIKTRFHQNVLPPEPQSYQDVMRLPSPHKEGFTRAMQCEIDTIKRKGTYKKRAWKDFNPEDHEVLPLIWVFKYKLDNDGYLSKYKARICVRGDLQTTAEETYTATLAIRIFRALMAIAAYFNMEIRHYDAVNAFTNARLANPIYCHPPHGFSDPDYLWELHRALYGLKTSPLLWYEELTKTLRNLNLQEVKDAPCLWKNDKLLVFFYVDDIVVLARPGHIDSLNQFERNLLRQYEIRSLGDLSTFCGIQIHRNRQNGIIWLSQAAYIDKLSLKYPSPKKFNRPPAIPLPLEELLPSSEKTKNEANIYRYAQLVGSIGYIAGATRPDIAKTHSKLAEFLVNPSHHHIEAAYHTLAYLSDTRNRSLCYNSSISIDSAHIVDQEEPNFFGASDASYADDKATRKSSQGYIFFLCGGPIDWKATLQRCVTKSTTEAELIAASSAGTELLWWWRLFRDINFNPDNEQLLYCDNQQTIRLLTTAAPKLKTTLRHVDIHHHWLRQEVQNKHINLSYLQTKSQPADGLTKLLPRQRHENWVSLLHFDDFPS